MKKIFLLFFFITSLFSNNLQKVSLQLMWLDQFQFAGFYIAKEKDFYEKAGLEVEFKKFHNSTNVLNEVLEKRADFGISSTSLIVDKSKNKDVVVLGAIFQTSPLVLLALENSDLNSLKDLVNKRLMITQEQLEFATFKAMLISQNIDINSIKILPHSLNVNDLINKNTDLMLSYTTNEPFLLKEKGYESKIFYPKDYGFDFYEDLIFTTGEFARNNPKIVKDFYEASMEGWRWAFDNLEQTVNIIYEKYNPQNKSKEALLFEALEMKKLVFDEHGEIGKISKEKINLIINTYKVMGLIKNEIDLNTLLFEHNDDNNLNLKLNSDELAYLKTKKTFSYCSHSNLMPFESIVNRKHIGILEDYMKQISKSLNIDLKFVPTSNWHESFEKTVKNECDILTTIAYKTNRENLLNFTKPYVDFPFVIATDITKPFIDDINKLKDVKIALVKGFATSKLIQEKYKNFKFVEYPSLNDSLNAVKNGEVYAAIDSLAVIGYEIQNHFLGELKVSGRIDEQLKLHMATNIENKYLASILDKALDSINDNQKHDFFNKWVYLKYENNLDRELLIKISILLLIIFIIFAIIYRYFLLKKINKNLEDKIAFEIKQNEEKNRILMHQSKMAAMGEMLENIAHQWRQPLSTISVCTSGMELKKSLSKLDDKEFFDSINHIKSSVSYLSNTIDDFRNFLDQNKFISSVETNNLLKKVLDILNPSFANHNINVIKNIDEFEFISIENELIQVLMNILTNAKDALKELDNQKSRYIFIDIKKESDINLNIDIYDNGLGVNGEIIDRIFEPYFTTKHKSKGTGIGLYMSKLLVETHLKGKISVKNYKFIYKENELLGAKFRIILPLKIDV
ncbi:BvgS-like domain-containing signal transduction sensor histidine kinase (NMT1 domain) [Aliarcobacter cibarius]|uniref:histidine kinase n=1 Tax=Aliarcobacter cibarius TaxID=255507 RepID=A0A7L5JSR4_9BACT|nr:ABC transporter substrate-binding protein [Aliarcobacter cibarius]QKJ28120.1 BvgS-like domain-containing signal transduction sensor histidine kinase (NMT1 domain) [Aliarcobacter cibarius]